MKRNMAFPIFLENYIAHVILLFLLFSTMQGAALAGDYHIGSQNLYCSDCHTMHYSQDGAVPSSWGAEGPYANLLKKLTNEMCLMCHDGTNPSVPNVMGDERYVSSAGKFKATNPGQQHSLGGTDAPPGYSGTWGGEILTCVSCHNPHGNPYYRNLRPDPGGVPDLTVTYETGAVYGGEAAIQQQVKTPLTVHYSVENIGYRQTESGANYGLSPWCAGCHTDYYGNGGDTNMGGSPSGDTLASGTDTWIRHPTTGITLSEGVTNLHIDGEAENGTGYWWSSQILSRPPYISPSGLIGTKSSTDNETGCNSCHKAHGSDQKDCLIFDDPETASLEDGLRMVGTCQACHLTGGGYYETSPHGDPDNGLLRLTGRPQGDCQQCHLQHQGNPYNLFTENTNYLCYTTACHDFTPTGGYAGYPAQEEDRAPPGTTYTGYFEYFSGGSKAPGLNNRVRWPGMAVFEDTNTYITGPLERYFSPHRNDYDMPRRDDSESGMCLNCHSPHGTENPFDMLVESYLGTKESKNEDVPENFQLCFGCHSDEGPTGMDAETKRIADYYDTSINTSTSGHMIRKSAKSASYWPPHIQEGDRLACSNCHNPHGSRGHYNNNQPNARLISDQRPQWNGIVDTLSSASKCRSFCFGCHVPSDDPNCSLYSDPAGCPEVDGIIMKAIPVLPGENKSRHEASGDMHCENCHGRNYDATTSASPAFNVHNPKPSPGGGPHYRMMSAQVMLPPSGLAANPGMRLVELYWQKYTEGEIRGYNLYRSQSPGGPYTLIASEPDCIYRYIDKDVVPEQNYYYVLTIEDLNGVQSPYSREAGATPLSITPGQLRTLEQIEQLTAKTEDDRILLTWEESKDELVAGYYVYRRTEGGELDPVLLTAGSPIKWPVYEDKGIEKGNIYLYSVVAVDRMGNEARFPREVRAAYGALLISSVSLSQGERPLKGGDEMIVTLTGSIGGDAYFDIEGLATNLPMEEVGGTGTYIGTYIIPKEIPEAQAGVSCFLRDSKGNATHMSSSAPLRIDNQPPAPPVSLEGALEPDGGVSLKWTIGDKGTAACRVYRIAGEVKDPDQKERIASGLSKDTSGYKDMNVLPGTTYHYTVTAVDEAGNESPTSVFAKVVIPADTTPPLIIDMQLLAGVGVWRPGEEIAIVMTGEPFCRARFSIGDRIRDIEMKELVPGGGRYKGTYTFREEDMGEEMQISGKLTDRAGNSATYDPRLKVSVIMGSGGKMPVIYEVQENSFQTGGDEGLVAGDMLQIRVNGTPGCNGVFHLGARIDEARHVILDWSGFREGALSDISGFTIYRKDLSAPSLDEEDRICFLGLGTIQYTLPDDLTDIPLAIAVVDGKGHPYTISTPRWNIPLKETEEKGVYQGEYAIKPGDKITQGYIYVSLLDKTGTPSLPYQSPHTITIDTGSRIEVKSYPPELRADRSSIGRIQITLKDARGKGVPGREAGLALFTTSEFTSMAGTGRLNDIDIGGIENMLPGFGRPTGEKEPYGFTTDNYGRIEVEYQSGFASKTLIFRVRDMITGDIGTGYVTSYIEAQAQVEQYLSAKRMKDLGQQYAISISSLPEWLTADGISTARITAKVIDENGGPVEGHRVVFTISMGDGRLMQQEAQTDMGGVAEVAYRAGTRIGTVEIRGVDVDAQIESKTYIILKSDAPALISIHVEPERIPADGLSQCRLRIKVTDIHGNPSRGAGISLTMNDSNGGRIVEADEMTDFLGQAEAVYQAGTGPGRVLFYVRITSKIPVSEELEEIIWAR